MNFHEERFPAQLSFGSVGGPERRTEIITLASGHEERNSPWEQSRRRYDAGVALRSLDDMQAVTAFFEARRGSLFGFRWKDWADYKSCDPSKTVGILDQEIATGDGVTDVMQLCKTYRSGEYKYCREVSKPIAGTVVVAIEGVEYFEGEHWTVDTTTGLIQFEAAPSEGAVVTAGFEFDVPVRFDSDQLALSVSNFNAGEIPNVPVIEVRV